MFPNEVRGRALFYDKLYRLGEVYSLEVEQVVNLDKDIVHEAFAAALSSAQFHQITPLSKLSHYKELAHLAFWIAELKPFAIPAPVEPKFHIHWGRAAAGATGEEPPPTKAALRSFERATQQHAKFATYPINEHIALEFITNLAEAELERKLQRKDKTSKAEIRTRFAYFQSKLNDGLIDDLVKSLRFHAFAPRSFATMIEAIFAFEGL